MLSKTTPDDGLDVWTKNWTPCQSGLKVNEGYNTPDLETLI
jgi:hypothetical protein